MEKELYRQLVRSYKNYDAIYDALQGIMMATNKQIIEALRGVRKQFPSNSSYINVHRNVISISNNHSVMVSDIKEISEIIKDGDGDNK